MSTINPSREYLKSLTATQRKKLAASVSPPVTHEYLYMIGANQRNPGRKLVVQLEVLTHKKVKSADFDAEAKAKISA